MSDILSGAGAAADAINGSSPSSLQSSDTSAIQDRGDLVRTYAAGYGNMPDMMSADTGVRYVDGVVAVRATDLASVPLPEFPVTLAA
jgi:hypothetical protein